MRRRQIAATYGKAFANQTALEQPVERPDCVSAWHLYVIKLKLEHLKVGRDRVFEALRAENIGVNVHYIPIPWMSHYASLGYVKGNWPVAEGAYERIISLPIYPSMTDQDISDVVTAVNKVLKAYIC